MLPPRRNKQDDEDQDAWLITYADMVTLLLCFFVIMFSLSEPNGEKFNQLAEELKKRGMYLPAVLNEDPYDNLKNELDANLGQSGYSRYMNVNSVEGGIEVEMAASAFFPSGQARFSKQALPMLKLLSDQMMALKDQEVRVVVEGHTDDSPISTSQFPSNWELSSGRASSVVRYLIAQGFPPEKLQAVGLADTEPKAPNRDSVGTPLPGNQDLNRRVVVKLSRKPN
jgi:chemotaxis protein MotB